MADKNKPPPFIAWGLWREQRKAGAAVEWRELGPVFVNEDGSGGIGHFKSVPTSGWNYRFAFRRYGEGPPPVPVLRKNSQQPQRPGDDDSEGDEAEE